MRYSFSEFSPYSRQNYTEPIKPFNVKNTVETSEKKGVPNYTTVIPTATEVGRMDEPPRTEMPNTMPGTAPTTPAQPRTMPRTMPGNAPTTPNQHRTMPGNAPMPERTMPGNNMPEMMPGAPMHERTMPGNTPTTPTQPRTMPGNNMPGMMPGTPMHERTMPGNTPTTPTQPRTMPGNNMPGMMPGAPMPERTMPGNNMPGMTPGAPMHERTMPGNNMPGMTPGNAPTTPMQPRTMPGTTPMPRTMPQPRTMPATPGQTCPSMPRTTPPAQTQEYYNDSMDPRYMNGFDDCEDDFDDGYDDMMMPGMFMNSSVPMGIPMMPLYGYDNSEDADKDWDYMRQMYPDVAKNILSAVDEQLDKLEYDGSSMFDEYPDRVYLSRIADNVYENVKYLEDDDPFVSPESLNDPEKSEDSAGETIKYSQFYRDGSRNRRDSRRRRPANLRNLVDVILFHELLHRRRRYRSRKRWF